MLKGEKKRGGGIIGSCPNVPVVFICLPEFSPSGFQVKF